MASEQTVIECSGKKAFNSECARGCDDSKERSALSASTNDLRLCGSFTGIEQPVDECDLEAIKIVCGNSTILVTKQSAATSRFSITSRNDDGATTPVVSESHRCKYCFQTFFHRASLDLHEKHCGCAVPTNVIKLLHEERHECSYCKRTFLTSDELKTHQNTSHKDVAKPYKCSQCHFRFERKAQLQRHEKVHLPESRRFKCTHCDKRFRTWSEVQQHEMTHTGKKPFECSFCHQGFTCASNLKRHEKVHAEERFECSYCNDRFSERSVLLCHESAHLGIKPYECGRCGKRFGTRFALSVHEASHKEKLCS